MTSVHPTAIVADGAELGADVEIGPYSIVGPNVSVGDGTRIMSHVVLDGFTKMGRGCTVFPFASIGLQTQDLKYSGGKTFVEIGDKTTLREYVTVNSGTNEGEVTRIGSNCHIMAYCHVAHACRVGNEVVMSNCATLAGEVDVHDQAILGGFTAVHQFVRIGRLCMTGGCTKVTQDCPPFMIVDGNPASVRGVNVIGLERRGVAAGTRKLVKQAYKILYRDGLSTSQALERMRSELVGDPDVDYAISFIESSERGIVK